MIYKVQRIIIFGISDTAKIEMKNKAQLIKRETAKHIDAFLIWYGQNRNYDKTRTKLGVNKDTLASWIKSFNWHARADEIDKRIYSRAIEKLTTESADRLNQLIERHFRFGDNLIALGSQYLGENGIENGTQAIRAIQIGVAIQIKAIELSAGYDDQTNGSDSNPAFTLEDWKTYADSKLDEVQQQVAGRTLNRG